MYISLTMHTVRAFGFIHKRDKYIFMIWKLGKWTIQKAHLSIKINLNCNQCISLTSYIVVFELYALE